MLFGISYFDLLILLFFVISTYILLVNLYTIAQLRREKREMQDDQKLLVQLIGQIQGYFSKIDTNIERVADNERNLHRLLDTHQKDEDAVLKTLELNQELFLDRMDRIINIQQELSKRISILDSGTSAPISPEMIKAANLFMGVQKRDLGLVKAKLDTLSNMANTLNSLEERLTSMEKALTPDFTELLASLKRGVNQNLLDVNQSFAHFDERLKERLEHLQQSNLLQSEAQASMQTLNSHIDLAKRNIANVIEQSLDLSPIYKSIYDLIDQTRTIFDDYFIAKGEIEKLLKMLQDHEHKDLIDLRQQVEAFLAEIKTEMKDSVDMLKKEYHLGQNQVTDTVKTLSERSAIKEAYENSY